MNNNLYEVIDETINYLRDYYLDWQDYIERFSFPRMDYYYLIINISSFYKMLDIAKEKLEMWNNNKEELNLLYTLLYIPSKISFTYNIYNNFKLIKKSLDYNDNAFSLLKENEEDKKTN